MPFCVAKCKTVLNSMIFLAQCLRGCRKVLTFAPAFEEQPRGRQREEFFDRLRQTEDRYKQRAAIEAGGWQ